MAVISLRWYNGSYPMALTWLLSQIKTVELRCIQLSRERTSNTDWSGDCMGQSINQGMNGSWDTYLASKEDFAEADAIITNLAKEREPGIEIINPLPNL